MKGRTGNTFSRVGGHLPRLQGAPAGFTRSGAHSLLETTLPTTTLPGPLYRPLKPRPLLAYLDEDEHFFLPPKPDGKALRRLKVLKPYADALSRVTEALNWAVQQPDGGWPQVYADRKQHNPFSGQWEPVGSLPHKSCLLALSGYTCAVGTADRPGLALKHTGAEAFDRAAAAMTFHCLRLDVDCDEVFDGQDLDGLRSVTDAVREAFSSLGLSCSVWATGGRGIQAVAPVSPCTWRELRQAEQDLKDLLSTTLPPGATADKGGTEGILRLPFGLHPRTGRLGLFVDEDCRTLPLEEQLGAMTAAYGHSASDLPSLAAVRTSRAQEPLQRRAQTVAESEPAPARRGRDGTGSPYWQRLRDERPEPGRTAEYLKTKDRIHAFVWAFGREGARQRLHEVMEETPMGPASDMAARRSRVDYWIDTYVDFKGARKQEPPKELHADDEAEAERYRRSLEGRKDYVRRQHSVYRAVLHARRTWGDAVDGGDVCRMHEHLYGKVASKTVYRALDAMREITNICSVTLSLEGLADDSGYLVTPEAFEATGHSSGSSAAIGQSIDAGHLFQPRKRSSPSAKPCRSVQPARSTSRQSARSPDSGSEATARTYAVSACT